MHNFDPELIAALAEGTLGAAEATALEAQIAADPAAVADLAAQRAVLAALRTAGSPRLDERERIALHASVATQLGLTAGVAPVRARRRVAWGPLAVAASTLVAIVAFAPMVADLAGGSDDAGTVSAEGGTTVATDLDAFEAVPHGTGTPSDPTANTTDGAILEVAGDDAATTTVAGMADRSLSVPQVANDLALLKSDPEALTVLEQSIEESTACVAEADTYFGSADLTTFEYPVENPDPTQDPTTYVVFHLTDPDGGPGTLVAFDPADCAMPIAVP